MSHRCGGRDRCGGRGRPRGRRTAGRRRRRNALCGSGGAAGVSGPSPPSHRRHASVNSPQHCLVFATRDATRSRKSLAAREAASHGVRSPAGRHTQTHPKTPPPRDCTPAETTLPHDGMARRLPPVHTPATPPPPATCSAQRRSTPARFRLEAAPLGRPLSSGAPVAGQNAPPTCKLNSQLGNVMGYARAEGSRTSHARRKQLLGALGAQRSSLRPPRGRDPQGSLSPAVLRTLNPANHPAR